VELSPDITTIVIKNGMIHIGVGAFFHCGVETVTFPGSVTRIGGDAFYTNVDEVQSAVETLVKAGTDVTVAVDYEKKADKFDVSVTGGKL
jgi:hypothetical protein